VPEFFDYLGNNKGTLLEYGKRYRAGKLISTAMADSVFNQVVNARMCKRQQMRWSPRGAHLLVQVRCAVANGLFADWSPEQISGWLSRAYPDFVRCASRMRRSTSACTSGRTRRSEGTT
jgi:hypothetical protein